MLCSIFIASTTHTSLPALTGSPGRTNMDITRPDRGDTMVFVGTALAELGDNGGVTTIPGG